MSTTVTPKLREKLIAEAKAREGAGDIISLVGNLPTMRMILAWPMLTVIVPETDVSNANNIMRDCRKIWLGVDVDLEEISKVARIPYSVVSRHVLEAQMNLWVYPDGTVHNHARDLAKSTIVKLAKGRATDAGNK